MTWRTANLVGFVLWLLVVPAALVAGWYHSLAFIAGAAMYENAVSHLAAWRADVPTEREPQAHDLADVLRELDRRAAMR